jgi:hypothetical protein
MRIRPWFFLIALFTFFLGGALFFSLGSIAGSEMIADIRAQELVSCYNVFVGCDEDFGCRNPVQASSCVFECYLGIPGTPQYVFCAEI